MSKLKSIRLGVLVNTLPCHKSESKSALVNLATRANGPLRLKTKVKNGATVYSLGVRKWKTYFFEKLLATDKQKADARRETMVAIEKFVRPFLHKTYVDGEFIKTPEDITARLYSMVTRRPLERPKINASVPCFKSGRKFAEVDGSLFHGIQRVPDGLSIGTRNPLRTIADVHLVRKTCPESYLMGNLQKGWIVEQKKFHNLEHLSASDFEHEYLYLLNQEKGEIKTSVVLELQLDDKGHCSPANLEGAKCAAEKFLSSQNNANRHISIMLIVPCLPTNVGSAGIIDNAVDPDGKT